MSKDKVTIVKADPWCLAHGFAIARMGQIEACGTAEACDAFEDVTSEHCATCGFFGPGGYMNGVCTCGESDVVVEDYWDV